MTKITTESARISDLLQRIARLEDEKAVYRTLHGYCLLIDHGSNADWLDLFTEDGVFDVRIPGDRSPLAARGGEVYEHGVRFAGQQALAGFIAARNSRATREQKHNTIHPLIEIDGDMATAQSYYIATAWDEGKLEIYGVGRYVDRLARGTDGRWRFKQRLCLGAGPRT